MSWMRQVGKVVCVGRNYAAHARELGHGLPAAPFFFLKPASALVAAPGPVRLPHGAEVHHEVELGVVVGRAATRLRAEDAAAHIAGYVVALDMTARDEQRAAQAAGRPWAASKGRDTFAPVGRLVAASEAGDVSAAWLELSVDGEVRQAASVREMVHGVPQLLAAASSIMRLDAGDLLLTGTPAGVGRVRAGQTMRARWGVGERVLDDVVFGVVEADGGDKAEC